MTAGSVPRCGPPAAPAPAPVPDRVPVVLDADVRRLGGGAVLLGGDPGRLVRLGPAGRDALTPLAAGRTTSTATRSLARTLVDAGLAHPRPGTFAVHAVTVVVPTLDRAGELDRCLTALGREAPVLVVDDGSRDPTAVAVVCHRHGARLVRRDVTGGPAAARNTGLAATGTGLVAFVDGDCLPSPGWLGRLVGHLADPLVAAAAPRVRAAPEPGLLARYAGARGPLDLGPREALVRPGTRVPYVPTAALLVRRAALPEPAFHEALRYGEDVDLVWRLHDAGWQTRYDPRCSVGHSEPDTWSGWLLRRHRYGTSAAPLAERHGRRLTPLVLAPWPTAAWLLLAARRPLLSLAAAAVPAVRLHGRIRRTGLSTSECATVATRVVATGLLSTVRGLGGAGTTVTAPVLLALLAVRRTRRAGVLVLLAPALLDHAVRRPALDPVRWTTLRLLDDLAYASGVWRGCWTGRSLEAICPTRTRPR